MTIIDKILDTARWAPSADNTQPWCFEYISEWHFVVRGFNRGKHGSSVYDQDGTGSNISLGILLETIEIAAAEEGVLVSFERREEEPDSKPVFDVFLEADENIQPNPLFPYITERSVQRRAMSMSSLTLSEKQQLEDAVAPLGLQVVWFGRWSEKIKISRLLFKEFAIRLKLPETYDLHHDMLEFGAKYSTDKVPDHSLGLDFMTLKFMKWTMKSRERMNIFGSLPGGHVMPGIEITWLPGLFCATHYVLLAEQPPKSSDDYIHQIGRGMQKIWLTATKLGLLMQPEMTTLSLARYIREGKTFTSATSVQLGTETLSEELTQLIGKNNIDNAVLMGRFGRGKFPQGRSLRLPLDKLMYQQPA